MGKKKGEGHPKNPPKKLSDPIVQQPVAQSPVGYADLLDKLKRKITTARVKATFAANCELILLYWEIGREILNRQQQQGWGARVIDRLAADLRHEFPQMTGLSPRNLKYMRAFAEAYGERRIVQRVVAQIPWGHNTVLLEKLPDTDTRVWYAWKASENGWSRAVLTAQIESGLHIREGAVASNFRRALPKPQSDLAQQAFKDPFIFDFLKLTQKAKERDLENALIDNIQHFLVEMGYGRFAFVGRQFPLKVGGDEFFVDLLLYHLHLHCYVVIDLKVGKFVPEFAGKMNFYLAAVDEQMRRDTDATSIGLILCKERNRLVVEYALSKVQRPIGVPTWQLTRELPTDLKNELPGVKEIEANIPLPRIQAKGIAKVISKGTKTSKKPKGKKK